METIINNPGLQHLAEKVFWNLDVKDLKICAQINQSCKQILEDPKFWLKKFISLSKENQKDWIKVIKQVKSSDERNAIISYLQWNLVKGAVDLTCYSSPSVQDELRKEIFERCKGKDSSNENTEIVKILAPLTDNPNTPNAYGSTPIHEAANNGYTEIIKILAPLTNNPNSPDKYGETPLHAAADEGHTEIVQILVPLTSNPNAPDTHRGATPIHLAAYKGHTKIVKILTSLTNNPITPNYFGSTPIYWAAQKGHTEIVKFLVSLTDNPNAPNFNGKTPCSVAANEEIHRILTSSKKYNASGKKPSKKRAKKF